MNTLKSVIIGVLLVLSFASTSAAQFESAPVCYAGFVPDLRRAIGSLAEANAFMKLVKGYNEVALKGTADVLHYVGADDFYETFTTLAMFRSQPKRMPAFADDEEIFETIGSLTTLAGGNDFDGITSLIGNLASEEQNASGALFSLFIAREAADNGTNYARLKGLELLEDVPGTTRRRQFDVVTSGLPPTKLENKNWGSGIPTSGFPFNDFMDEFVRDILIDGLNDFRNIQYNILLPPGANIDVLLPDLLRQFEDPTVRAVLGDELNRVVTKFTEVWTSRRLVKLYAPVP
jgi:hypothetical protein